MIRGKVLAIFPVLLILCAAALAGCSAAPAASSAPTSSISASSAAPSSDVSVAASSAATYSPDEFSFDLPQGAALAAYTPKVLYMLDLAGDPASGLIVDYDGEFQLTLLMDASLYNTKTTDEWQAIANVVNSGKPSPYPFPDLTSEGLYNANISWKYGCVEMDILSPKYPTHRGVHVGSTRAEVEAAYKDFPLVTHPAAALDPSSGLFFPMNIHSMATLGGNTVKNPFLSFNNGPCFTDDNPNGEPFGGSAEMTFLFDDSGNVSRILSYSPTAG